MKRFVQIVAATTVATASFTVSSLALADPPSVPTRDVETIEESVPNRGLIVSGAIVLGATYGSSAIVGATSSEASDRALFVPLAGPWIDLANRDDSGSKETTYKVLLVADGIGQGLGALQIVGGFLFPAKRTVTRVGSPTVNLAPRAGADGYGLGAYGTF